MTLILNSLTDIKRALKIPGLTIKVIDHWQSQLEGTTRVPIKVMSDGRYTFKGPDGRTMWSGMSVQKARDLKFYGDDRVRYYPGTERSWLVQFLPPTGELV